MNIRRAKEKDIERVMELLGQVLQIQRTYALIFLFRGQQNIQKMSWQK